MSEKSPSAKQRFGVTPFAKAMFAFAWPLAGIYLCALFISAVFEIIGFSSPTNQAFFQDNPQFRAPIDLLVNLAILLFVVVPFYHLFFGAGTPWRQVFALQRRPLWQDAGLAFVAYGAYFLVLIIVISLLDRFVPSFNMDEVQQLGITQPETLIGYIGIFFILAIIPPMVEELIFRGFMFSALRDKLSFWPTAILVSIAFAVVHGQWNVGVDVFILSLFLCALREYTKSLWPAILLHSLKNTIAFVALYIIKVEP